MPKVIVLGLGAMGSSAAQELAERGHRVLGFDLFTPPHVHGSSHGETRIIRQAYWEDWRYVPLLFGAYESWRKLEATSGQKLLHITGGLCIGPANGKLVSGCEETSRRQVTTAAGFSGHGFKFASVMGEVLADLATDATPSYGLDLFSLRRFAL